MLKIKLFLFKQKMNAFRWSGKTNMFENMPNNPERKHSFQSNMAGINQNGLELIL